MRWLLLVYKVPSEPSARRVYVWRKLKRLGAILLHDAVWVLPLSDRNREQLQWLAAEIMEFGGDALVWEAQQLFQQQETAIIAQFNQQVEAVYQTILDQLAQAEPEVAALSRQYQQAASQDYFQSPLGQQVREALIRARGEA